MTNIVLVISQLLEIYSLVVIVYVLMSWFPNARESSFGRIIGSIVRPYLEPFQKFIPSLGMIDISPIVALLVLRFASEGAYRLAFML
ncbi:YggT family protein [Aureibacillus halotolerans]|nr:YggT family protein [Aureibacillus halotolerans]